MCGIRAVGWWLYVVEFLFTKVRDQPYHGLQARKLSEISKFQNLMKLRFHVTLVYINGHNLLNFEATGLIFCKQA